MDEAEGVNVEPFRTFLIRCPHCGGDVVHRLNLDGPHAGNHHAATRCPSCKEFMSRRQVLRARIRQQAVEGVSFDCNRCGRANFVVGQPDVCSFCGEPI